jgi:FGGY-family pentulose kinase
MIDAHAGGLGVLGACHTAPQDCADFSAEVAQRRIALISGTSTCHMAVSPAPIMVKGVWGPYMSAMIPGMALNEGGESATGALIDHVVKNHRAFPHIQSLASLSVAGTGPYDVLNALVEEHAKRRGLAFSPLLAESLHILPYFHGNRSPLADPTLHGMITGLTLAAAPEEDLVVTYVATVVALALGTRHIIEEMNSAGHKIQEIYACGGLCKNSLFLQLHADATGFPVVLAQEQDAVLVGAAVLGACASGDFPSIFHAMVCGVCVCVCVCVCLCVCVCVCVCVSLFFFHRRFR